MQDEQNPLNHSHLQWKLQDMREIKEIMDKIKELKELTRNSSLVSRIYNGLLDTLLLDSQEVFERRREDYLGYKVAKEEQKEMMSFLARHHQCVTFKPCSLPVIQPDFESSSGSRYWFTAKNSLLYVIRSSDHWGEMIKSNGDCYHWHKHERNDDDDLLYKGYVALKYTSIKTREGFERKYEIVNC